MVVALDDNDDGSNGGSGGGNNNDDNDDDFSYRQWNQTITKQSYNLHLLLLFVLFFNIFLNIKAMHFLWSVPTMVSQSLIIYCII